MRRSHRMRPRCRQLERDEAGAPLIVRHRERVRRTCRLNELLVRDRRGRSQRARAQVEPRPAAGQRRSSHHRHLLPTLHRVAAVGTRRQQHVRRDVRRLRVVVGRCQVHRSDAVRVSRPRARARRQLASVATGMGGGSGTTTARSPSPPATDRATTITATTTIATTTVPATAAAPAPIHTSGRVSDQTMAGMADSARKGPRRCSGRQAASSWRPGNSSFPSMFEMWYLTASRLMPRRAAMSAFVPPSRNSSRTCHSAGVRMSGWRGRRGDYAPCAPS